MSFGSATERQRHHTNRNIQAGGSGGGSSADCSRSSGSGDRNGGASTTVEIGNENMTAAAAATTSSDVVTEKSSEKHASVTSTSSKKVRRAFSMPRNPFRWSRKFRTNSNKEVTSSDASISTPGSKKSGRVVEKHSQLSSEEQLANSNNDRDCMLIHLPGDPDNSAGSESSNKKSQSQRSESITSAANRVLRRSSFRKFLTRIAQHVTSVSIGVSVTNFAPPSRPCQIFHSLPGATGGGDFAVFVWQVRLVIRTAIVVGVLSVCTTDFVSPKSRELSLHRLRNAIMNDTDCEQSG